MKSNYSISNGSVVDSICIISAYCSNPNWGTTILKGWGGGKGTFGGR